MKIQTYCPSPPLPVDEISPPRVPLGTKHENLRWFITTITKKPIPTNSPLGRIFALLEDPFNPPMVSETQRAYLIRLTQVFRLGDWGVNALCAKHTDSTRVVDLEVDEAFVTGGGGLFFADDQSREMTLPSGIGTLHLAGRLVQGGRGGRVRISGDKVEGHDITYESPLGPILVERRDRAYQAGLNDTPPKRLRWMLGEIEKKGPNIPQHGPARILSFGFWTGDMLTREEFKAQFSDPIEAEIRKNPTDSMWPDCLLLHALAGYNTLIGGRLLINPRPEFERIKPVIQCAMPEVWLVRALTMGPDGRPMLIERWVTPVRDQ